MSDIKPINKTDATSTSRKVMETSVTSIVWGLWLYLLLPVVNVLLWIVGIATINTQFFENDGYMVFIELVQQMGLAILIAFVIMRLWGLYNYYRFGRLARRSRDATDSIVKMSNYYQVKPHVFLQLEGSKEIIWPLRDDDDGNVGNWLQQKENQLTPDQTAADEGTIMMRFHDIRGKGMPSITQAVLISLIFVLVLALILLYAAGGFQRI
jgi:poly-beta-1,6-N-acetyl-D-glucosamine biosynthesis protein PgaD